MLFRVHFIHVHFNRLTACLVLLLLMAQGCGSGAGVSGVVSPPASGSMWVGAWANAMTNAEPNATNKGGSNRTFRFVFYPTVGGKRERVRFSNYYGKTPVTIGAARLAVGTDGKPAIEAAQNAPLTFNGQSAVTLAPGQVISSDPVNVTFAFGQVLAVSIYLQGTFGSVSRHNSLFTTNYSGPDDGGDLTASTTGAGLTASTNEWLLVNGLDVYGDYQGTVVLFGSSTTDGFHSDYSADQVYPAQNKPVPGQHSNRLSDWLARRLNAAGYRIGVVNLGIPGDTVTDDSSNQQGHVLNANQRIAHDVLTVPIRSRS